MLAPAQRARRIRLLILDVDGVLTDGGLYFGPRGEEWKRFHAHDGAGIKAVQRAGIAVALVSGRSSAAVERRAAELEIKYVVQGADDKGAVLESLQAQAALSRQAVAAVGDDVGDLPMLQRAGLAVAVASARPEVKAAAHWITAAGGGQGAVREICDLLLTVVQADD